MEATVVIMFAKSKPISITRVALVAVSCLYMIRDPTVEALAATAFPVTTGRCHVRGFGLEGTIAGMLIGGMAAATVSAFAAETSNDLIGWVQSESGCQTSPMPGCSAVFVRGGGELEDEELEEEN